MNKQELEAGLLELDEALVKAFPGPDPIECLVVGGACLILQGVTDRSTHDIDVFIFNLMNSPEEMTLIKDMPIANKMRQIIKRIGRKRYQLKGEHALFFNDHVSPFLAELSRNDLPPMRLLVKYTKLRLYVPVDTLYILGLKILAGRADKDFDDIQKLCQLFGIRTRAEAQGVVNKYFTVIDQYNHRVPRTLQALFPDE
jgi:hypothetical protein